MYADIINYTMPGLCNRFISSIHLYVVCCELSSLNTALFGLQCDLTISFKSTDKYYFISFLNSSSNDFIFWSPNDAYKPKQYISNFIRCWSEWCNPVTSVCQALHTARIYTDIRRTKTIACYSFLRSIVWPRWKHAHCLHRMPQIVAHCLHDRKTLDRQLCILYANMRHNIIFCHSLYFINSCRPSDAHMRK